MTGLVSPAHIVVLLVVLLLVFGTKRLPELGRSLGSGLREFKHSVVDEPGPERAMLAAAPETVAAPTTVTPAMAGASPVAADSTAPPPAA